MVIKLAISVHWKMKAYWYRMYRGFKAWWYYATMAFMFIDLTCWLIFLVYCCSDEYFTIDLRSEPVSLAAPAGASRGGLAVHGEGHQGEAGLSGQQSGHGANQAGLAGAHAG